VGDAHKELTMMQRQVHTLQTERAAFTKVVAE
jgi:hypothetical protein